MATGRKKKPSRRRSARACTAPQVAISRNVILPRDGPDYLGAADFLALLAYPGQGEADKRTKLCRACAAHVVKILVEGTGLKSSARKKGALSMRNAAIGKAISAAWRRIRNRRIPAADLFFRTHWFNGQHALDRVFRDMKAAKIINRIEAQAESAKRNIITRVRAESRPVLHLAMALNAVIHRGPKRKIDFYTLLNNPDWVRSAIDSAEKSRRMFIAVSGDPSTCSARLSYRLE